ncbi:unnamed protein product [Peronospora farinosa]|uniref:Pseudouridine synthase RsuA/RluA-like domain-containing protein n=1 Tax=Peronospora farinosa TaxID=134698 RepID=A0AAV0SYM4_9STRA|nr:unnamed protein product [Peronospora farinosa]CAI5708960.1 unnamed protein product [Peronospora farinosa]
MGIKRKNDFLATNVMPAKATLEIRQLIAAAIETLQMPMDAFGSTGNSEIANSNRIRSLGLDKLKRVPKLQPPGSIHSSNLALRLFYSCRKAKVATKCASKDSENSIIDSPLKLAALCVDALNLELGRRPYHHIVRVWLPEKEDVALGALPDRVLVQIREFATCRSNDAIYPTLTAELPLTILFRDDAIIVVDKPANVLSIDGTDPDASMSVHRCIANVYPEARMVHRLDQETSGLLVVALTKSAAQSLNAQFRDRLVEKTYVARVHGWIEEESESPRSVRVPMEKHPIQPLVQRVVLDREVDPSSSLWSLTEYCVRSRAMDDGTQTGEDRKSTIINLKPVTGKTHQLRLHMQHIGHPILGDSLYSSELVYHRASRLCLHAAKLSFAHPVTTKRLSFESSCPADFFTTQENKSAKSQRTSVPENNTRLQQARF